MSKTSVAFAVLVSLSLSGWVHAQDRKLAPPEGTQLARSRAELRRMGILSSGKTLSDGTPAYCRLENLLLSKTAVPGKGLIREEAFRFGDLLVMGVAVGFSSVRALKSVAQEASKGRADASRKFCTFYFNHERPEHEATFVHHYLPRPNSPESHLKWLAGIKDEAMEAELAVTSAAYDLGFREQIGAIIDCAEDTDYLALGCNGQTHRGPTVFGMLLAYTGCKPAEALRTVNALWKLGIDVGPVPVKSELATQVIPEVRQHMIELAYRQGVDDPAQSSRLRELLLKGWLEK